MAIYPPDITTDDAHANHLAVRILGQMRQHLCLMDMTDVLDLSILDESGTTPPTLLTQRLPDVALLVSLSKVGSFAEIGIQGVGLPSRKPWRGFARAGRQDGDDRGRQRQAAP